jgi:hypothetical protein
MCFIQAFLKLAAAARDLPPAFGGYAFSSLLPVALGRRFDDLSFILCEEAFAGKQGRQIPAARSWKSRSARLMRRDKGHRRSRPTMSCTVNTAAELACNRGAAEAGERDDRCDDV